MTFRSRTCEGCFGSGEIPSVACESGTVFQDGGIASCPTCFGTGREIFETPKPDAKKVIEYGKKIDAVMKRNLT